MKLYNYYISFLFLRYLQIKERYPDLLLDAKRFCAWDPFILMQLSPHTITSLKPFSSYVDKFPNIQIILSLFLKEIFQNVLCLISLFLHKSVCISSQRWVSNQIDYNNVLTKYFHLNQSLAFSESCNIGFITLPQIVVPHHFKRINFKRNQFFKHFLSNEKHWQQYLEREFVLPKMCTANDVKSFLIFLQASSRYNIVHKRFSDICFNFVLDLVNLPLMLVTSLKGFSVNIISTCLWNLNNPTVDLLIDSSIHVNYFGCQHGARYFEVNDPLHELEIQFPLFTDYFSFGLSDPVISPSLILQRQSPKVNYDILLVQSCLIESFNSSRNFLNCIESLIEFKNNFPNHRISVRLHPKQRIDILFEEFQILFPLISGSLDIFDTAKTCGIFVHVSSKSDGVASKAKIVIFDHPFSTLFWYIDKTSSIKKILCYDQGCKMYSEVNSKYFDLYDSVLTDSSLLLNVLSEYSSVF